MNPFTTPDKLFISRRPQDMRAGIQRLASVVTTDFGMDPTDGALYCFVSRDCNKMKLLRFEADGWCMYYVRLAEGGFRWRHDKDGEVSLQIERRQLIWLLDGIDFEQPSAPKPVAAHAVI
ncbi:IS66 family insertion sequence element accessory protein TnpB [Adlercreutzia sp. ZJ473]|uniref:IS66 family insertion sequence element accessory protein TnpB n=1 Tax=Adlercreutzia sp. ZJ473 TaxID=2722822 RepID=UPI001555B5FC|nr:IS66 family insertion sequence element accessory protein TnpB [Adlercreutzia sp. ZJ473]